MLVYNYDNYYEMVHTVPTTAQYLSCLFVHKFLYPIFTNFRSVVGTGVNIHAVCFVRRPTSIQNRTKIPLFAPKINSHICHAPPKGQIIRSLSVVITSLKVRILLFQTNPAGSNRSFKDAFAFYCPLFITLARARARVCVCVCVLIDVL